jgi:hypothetical protein
MVSRDGARSGRVAKRSQEGVVLNAFGGTCALSGTDATVVAAIRELPVPPAPRMHIGVEAGANLAQADALSRQTDTRTE